MENRNESKKVVIECGCGTHLLKVQSEIDFFKDIVSEKETLIQQYYLAMYQYGIDNHKPNILNRIKIACRYVWNGKMFSDQLCLHPDEMHKLNDFINDTLIEE